MAKKITIIIVDLAIFFSASRLIAGDAWKESLMRWPISLSLGIGTAVGLIASLSTAKSDPEPSLVYAIVVGFGMFIGIWGMLAFFITEILGFY